MPRSANTGKNKAAPSIQPPTLVVSPLVPPVLTWNSSAAIVAPNVRTFGMRRVRTSVMDASATSATTTEC